jgi:hypothetical protein
MKRMPALLTVVFLIVCWTPGFAVAAQTVSSTPVKLKSTQGHKAPMRHDQLTLYPHGRPARRQSQYGYARNRFNQPTPIHNTFMGVQRW